jgi:hypothetical protein
MARRKTLPSKLAHRNATSFWMWAGHASVAIWLTLRLRKRIRPIDRFAIAG